MFSAKVSLTDGIRVALAGFSRQMQRAELTRVRQDLHPSIFRTQTYLDSPNPPTSPSGGPGQTRNCHAAFLLSSTKPLPPVDLVNVHPWMGGVPLPYPCLISKDWSRPQRFRSRPDSSSSPEQHILNFTSPPSECYPWCPIFSYGVTVNSPWSS